MSNAENYTEYRAVRIEPDGTRDPGKWRRNLEAVQREIQSSEALAANGTYEIEQRAVVYGAAEPMNLGDPLRGGDS